MNKISNILWGITLIIVGLIFGLNALEITDINIFFPGWWTLFIIVPSIIDLFKEKDKTGNIISLFIGIFLLLGCNNIVDFNLIWKLIIPFTLVAIGTSLIFKNTVNSKIKEKIKELNKNSDKEYYATFSSQELNFSNRKFDDCNLNAIFGAINCDLNESTIINDTVINASAIFGKITIHIPSNITVKVISSSIFGDITDERKNKTKNAEITIYLNATCMFGGVEIK